MGESGADKHGEVDAKNIYGGMLGKIAVEISAAGHQVLLFLFPPGTSFFDVQRIGFSLTAAHPSLGARTSFSSTEEADLGDAEQADTWSERILAEYRASQVPNAIIIERAITPNGAESKVLALITAGTNPLHLDALDRDFETLLRGESIEPHDCVTPFTVIDNLSVHSRPTPVSLSTSSTQTTKDCAPRITKLDSMALKTFLNNCLRLASDPAAALSSLWVASLAPFSTVDTPVVQLDGPTTEARIHMVSSCSNVCHSRKRLFSVYNGRLAAQVPTLFLQLDDEEPSAVIEWPGHRTSDELESVVEGLTWWLRDPEWLAGVPAPGFGWYTSAGAKRTRLGEVLPGADWNIHSFLLAPPGDRLALIGDDQSYDYELLRGQAAAVAHHLTVTLGLRPGDRVALMGRRDIDSAVCLLGAWLAGISWCALDRALPDARRRHILDILAPQAVLDVAELSALKPIPLAGSYPAIPADQPAYFVSTSGSTGRPKLVALPAGGIAPLLAAWLDYYDLHEPQTVLQIGSWEGDVFLGDLLKALLSQGTLLICPDDRRVDARYLSEIVERKRVTFVETTPNLMRALFRASLSSACGPRVAVVGSDTFRLEEAKVLKSIAPQGTRVVNGYGLSECTIESLVFDLDDLPDLEEGFSGLCPIGVPLTGTRVRVVDSVSRLGLPPDAVGELVVESAGVAIGYVVDATEPVSKEPRLRSDGFATGDLASIDRKGRVHFHGRDDSLVKVRGYRIELGEIENAALSIQSVDEAFACTFDRGWGHDLALFLGVSPGLTELAVRHSLMTMIPDSVLPSSYYLLPRLPRLESGKLDRAGMTALARAGITTAMSIPASLDGQVSHAWEAVLGRSIDTRATFFDQGGTSLLVIALAERLRAVLEEPYVFSISDLFKYPTADSFTAALRQRAEESAGPTVSKSKFPDRRLFLDALSRGESSVEETLDRIRGTS